MSELSPVELAARIDSTLLKPEATPEQIDRLCDEAVEYRFWGVCINLFWLPRVVKRLGDADGEVKAITVVAFPSGSIPTAMKVYESRWALDAGADEIDMVANIGALKGGENSLVQDEIAAVAQKAYPNVGPAAFRLYRAISRRECVGKYHNFHYLLTARR